MTGISVTGSNNTIGGTTAAARNVISGNATQGINVVGSMNLIEGNSVGTNAAGTSAVPNGDGVDISGSTNTIGATTAGAGNTIADNTGNGVVVNAGTGNAVLSNPIYNNTVGGIELLNSGNNNQPSPVLTAAQLTTTNQLEVDGLLAVAAGTSYIVQYFGNNPASDQGQTLLGSQVIAHNHRPGRSRSTSPQPRRCLPRNGHGNRQRRDGPEGFSRPGDRRYFALLRSCHRHGGPP